MKPEKESHRLLGITRSKAKMYEYGIPEKYHLKVTRDPAQLLSLTIGIIGDYGKFDKNYRSPKTINRYIKSLTFSAQFFDSYVESNLDSSYSDYYLLIGSAAYYLADLPGNAKVLAEKNNKASINLDGEGLETFLLLLLKDDLSNLEIVSRSMFYSRIKAIATFLNSFYSNGRGIKIIKRQLNYLCQDVYAYGTDRQLLFVDIIRSVVKKQLYNSSWSSLRRYTNIEEKHRNEILRNSDFIKEFWPAQKILGEKNIYKGTSAIIQMPTSAGKTKSLEIIIRSNFYSGNTNMAVVVAPFRALCSEISHSLQNAFKSENISIDEPTDILQKDFDFLEDFDFEESKLILVLTPEKFIYILRNSPELVNEIGLLVYDEGHQFDNGIRGVTYELLLSSLKNKVSKETQVILISAVISNAESIGNWLIDDEKEIVSGANLLPTHRTIAFTNWETKLGMLQFVKNNSPEEVDYYVPRVIEQTIFPLRGKERNQRVFPENNDGKAIALYLALKLIGNGSVAIFCGSKSTVKTISEKVIDIANRGYDVGNPLIHSDQEEVEKLSFLHQQHFGETNYLTVNSKLGIYSHSGYTPEGLRLAIEYSMQKEKIRLVICTSTLAQGVNLPIKYLMVTSFYQAKSRLKTRDFHNLIGRAGRSGMHTEGSIIFTDNELYDRRTKIRDKWKWEQAVRMLDPDNSEPCSSTLNSIFEPLFSDDKKFSVAVSPLELVEAYVDSPEAILNLPSEFAKEHAKSNFTVNGLQEQLNFKLQIISSIESYLMAYWDDFDLETDVEGVDSITKGTLAYSISDEEQKGQLVELFRILAKNIQDKITTSEKRNSFGRTLLGVEDLLQIEGWTRDNIDSLQLSENLEDLLIAIWPILYQKATSKIKSITPEKFALTLTQQWVSGYSLRQLLDSIVDDAKYKAGKQVRILNQEHIIDICQNTFSYGITLTVGAISEIVRLFDDDAYDKLLDDLNLLQKFIKYGLPNQLAVAFYEIGFADRIIAQDLTRVFSDFSYSKSELKAQLRTKKEKVLKVLKKYPSYYENVLSTILNE